MVCSGYISVNTCAISNTFDLNGATSEFAVGNIITKKKKKKEHEIREVIALNKSESDNYQSIIPMDGVGFVTNTGMEVSVVRSWFNRREWENLNEYVLTLSQ